MTITIRDATPADVEIIATYNSLIARETEDLVLHHATLTAGVQQLLADNRKGRYWIAEADGQPIGQIMVTYEWSDWRNGMIWWIQSVYVHADYRRKGVFSALYAHVESLASAQDEVRGLRLYVERNNRRAQKTYETLGMVDPGYQVMQAMFDNDAADEGATSC